MGLTATPSVTTTRRGWQNRGSGPARRPRFLPYLLGPSSRTTRPSRMTASRSATVKASSWSWVTYSAVIPFDGGGGGGRGPAARPDHGRVTRAARRASRAEETAPATAPRRPSAALLRTMRSPIAARCRRPTQSSTSLTRLAASTPEAPAIRNPKATLPPTSRWGNRA